MSIVTENEIIQAQALDIAGKMVVAALTAPKGRGRDTIRAKIVYGEHLLELANKMKHIADETEETFFARDASNVLKAQAVVLLGVPYKSLGLKRCGYCGFKNCTEKEEHAGSPCSFNNIDLGIAAGSAVATASFLKADNRIMYTAGLAARELKWMDKDIHLILAIPVSISSKSPFFDRG